MELKYSKCARRGLVGEITGAAWETTGAAFGKSSSWMDAVRHAAAGTIFIMGAGAARGGTGTACTMREDRAVQKQKRKGWCKGAPPQHSRK